MWKLAVLLGLLAVATITHAAGVPEMPIQVNATSNDMVGQRFVYFVKEDIRSSSSLTLTIDSTLRMQLLIVTLDQNPTSPGNSTAYSVVLTLVNPQQPFPFYLNQYVGYCGSSRVKECAQDIVANTADEAEQVIRLLKTVYSK